MSGHLIGCAGEAQDLGKSHKLALVAFADSADDRTHIAFPGYEGVMKWASCSRSRAAELINDLEEAGYLLQHRRAQPGRRAEYVVFPGGCCDLHRPEAEPRPTVAAVVAWARDAGVELTTEQAGAMAHLGPIAPGIETPDLNGSEISDLSRGDRSETSDPFSDQAGNGSEISDPNGVRVQNGSGNGSETLDPFTTSQHVHTPPPPSPDPQPASPTDLQQRTRARDRRRRSLEAQDAQVQAERRARGQAPSTGTPHGQALVAAARAELATAKAPAKGQG